MSTKIGDVVIAIVKADDKSYEYLGEGLYTSDRKHPLYDADNPYIQLSNGQYVRGCECWFGERKTMLKMLRGKKRIQVDVEKFREKCDKYWEEMNKKYNNQENQ